MFLSWSMVFCTDQEPITQKIEEAYVAVREAGESHSDVHELIDELNSVLMALESGSQDLSAIQGRLDTVIMLAREEQARSVEATNMSFMYAGIQITIVLALVYVTWRYFPWIYWMAWLRVRGDWRVRYEDR